MSLSLKMDIARFQRDMKRLAEATKRTEKEVLDEQARLLVRDCVLLTPPFTPGRNFADSLAEQRRVGTAAVKRQVSAVFRPLDDLRVMEDESKTGKSLRRLVRTGQFHLLSEVLRKMGIPNLGVLRAATSEYHNQARDRRGRVPKKNAPYRVTSDRSIAGFIRRKMSHVGTAKAGWVKAADALGLRLPNWIRKRARGGVFARSGTPESPAIVVGNVVPFIQQSGAELQIIERALKNRRRNMPKQLEAALRAQARGGFAA